MYTWLGSSGARELSHRRGILRISLCTAAVLAANAATASAATISLQSGSGAEGSPDPIVRVVADDFPFTAEPRPATIITTDPNWAPPIGTSKWVSHSLSYTGGESSTYETTFMLPAGAVSQALSVTLHADNGATVALNGVVFGGQTAERCPVSNFKDAPDTFSTSTGFVAGVNTLTFTVPNPVAPYPCVPDSPTGLNFVATVNYEERPVADAGGDVSGVEGAAIDLDGGGTDADGDPLSYKWSYDASALDGGATCSFADDTAADTTITCTDDGPVTATLTVSDGTSSDTDSTLVTIANADPAIGALALSDNTGTACLDGNVVELGFTISDAGSNDTHSGTIDWGDGSTTPFTGSSFSGAHTYTAGTYTITVSATDDNGGTDSASSVAAVVLLYETSGFLAPINGGSPRSSFKLGSTIPVKVAVTDCTGATVTTLQPDIDLRKVDSTPQMPVNEVRSSGAANSGDDMQYQGGRYQYNLSTKNSQFCTTGSAMCANGDLTPGTYELKVSDPTFAPITQFIELR